MSAVSDAPKQKPNIIVILADDYGWGSAGCYGAPAQLKTPNNIFAANANRAAQMQYNRKLRHRGCELDWQSMHRN